MRVALLHNHFDAAHLEQVIEEMKTLGAPTVKVYDLGFDGMVQAIEGCHRLRACEVLEIEPTLDFVDSDSAVSDLGLDADFGDAETVAELGDYENYQIEVQA